MAESERSGLGAPNSFFVVVAFHIVLGMTCHPWGLEEGLAEEERRGSIEGVSFSSLPFSPRGKDQVRQELSWVLEGLSGGFSSRSFSIWASRPQVTQPVPCLAFSHLLFSFSPPLRFQETPQDTKPPPLVKF